jgi:hypothetical protein
MTSTGVSTDLIYREIYTRERLDFNQIDAVPYVKLSQGMNPI